MFIMHILKSATFKRWLIIGIAACIFVPVLMAGAVYTAPELSKANFIITRNQWFLTFFRWVFVIIFYLSWPWLIQRKSKTYGWTEKQENYWLQQRFKVFAWFAAFEILICENLFWKLFF